MTSSGTTTTPPGERGVPGLMMLNAGTNVARYMLSAGVFFVVTPMLVGHLGSEKFGLWSLIFAIAGTLGLLEFGVGNSIVKRLAAHDTDVDTRNRIVSTFICVYALLALAGLFLVAGLSQLLAIAFDLPPGQEPTARGLLLLLSARTLLVALPFGVFRAALHGVHRIYVANFLQSFATLIYGLGVVLAIHLDAGLMALAAVSLGCYLLEHLLYAVASFRWIPDFDIRPGRFDFALLRASLGFSAAAFVVQVSALVLLRIDPILVGIYLPLTGVAIYTVALRISENFLLLIKQLVNVLAPVASYMDSRGDDAAVRELLVRCTKWTMALTLTLALPLCLYAERLLVAWLGGEFAAGGEILTVLVIAVAMSVPQMTASTVLTFTGHHSGVAKAAALSVVINLIASIVLVQELGMLGIALGTLMATVIVDVAVVLKLACRRLGITARDYLKAVVSPLSVPVAAQAAVTVTLISLDPPTTLPGIAWQALPGCLVFSASFFFRGLEPEERAELISRLPLKGVSKTLRLVRG